MTDTSKLSVLRRRLSKFIPYLQYLVYSLIGLAILLLLHSFLPPLVKFAGNFISGPSSLLTFTKDPKDLLSNTSDRTNLLLLGMGGAGHEGADLTDSMVVISFDHPSKKISLISIPRDIWVDSMKAKINTAFHYGEIKQPQGGGLILAKSAVAEITGLPIHYAFSVDFTGFTKAIDLVGGINVSIDRTFDDYKYPIAGKENVLPESDRYEHLHFDKGPTQLDGVTALKFVRSRYAEGEEGTDFARSARQQKVIEAFRTNLLNQKTLLDGKKLNELFDLYGQYIKTDINKDEYPAFAKLVLLSDTSSIKAITLTASNPQTKEVGILENPKFRAPYQGQYVLIAKDNNWDALKQYIQNNLNR